MESLTKKMQQNELEKNHANYSPLTPIVFIEKAAKIFPDRLSIIHENKFFTWDQTFTRCKQLASSLSQKLTKGNVVGFIAFLVMVTFAVLDLVTGYVGKDLVINEFIYDSFTLVVLGCFGIAGLEKFAGAKK